MEDIYFSLLDNKRKYCLQFMPRNYPTFTGRYNVYVGVFGQLSGQYLGLIEKPLLMDVGENVNVNDLIDSANELINKGEKFSIW